jgi:hypothetical protein
VGDRLVVELGVAGDRLADERGEEDREEEQGQAVVAQRLHGLTIPTTV